MYQRVGAAAYKANLDNTIALLNVIDNPHQKLKCIHIAGTNGKGSVSHLIASALQESGYTCGLYVSPHYVDFRERIKINGDYISESFVVEFIEKLKPHIESISPSFFELTVAMAFDYFAQQKIDFAVIETGLGGRLDSTNVIAPLLSVITNISYDHMNLLGDTLQKISIEKAGIIKHNTPVVIGETQEETKSVFVNQAAASNATIYFADQETRIENFSSNGLNDAQFDIHFENRKPIANIHINYATAYQLKNCLTAAFSLQILNTFGLSISDHAIQNGFKNLIRNTKFIGRWQVINSSPITIVDSAHNIGGITEVLSQLASIKYRHLHWVYGTVNDKDLEPILALLPKQNCSYYLCKPAIPRGLDETLLLDLFHAKQLPASRYTSVSDAFSEAKNCATSEDLILVAGSIFVVAEVL